MVGLIIRKWREWSALEVTPLHFCLNTFINIPTSTLYLGGISSSAGLTCLASLLIKKAWLIFVFTRREVQKAFPYLCYPCDIYWPTPNNPVEQKYAEENSREQTDMREKVQEDRLGGKCIFTKYEMECFIYFICTQKKALFRGTIIWDGSRSQVRQKHQTIFRSYLLLTKLLVLSPPGKDATHYWMCSVCWV